MRLDEMNKVNGSASTRKINGFNDSLLSGYASTNRKDTTTRGSRVHANSYSSVKDVLDQHKVESRKKLRLALLQVLIHPNLYYITCCVLFTRECYI